MAGYTKADMEEIYRQGVLYGFNRGTSGMEEEDVADEIKLSFPATLKSLREEKKAKATPKDDRMDKLVDWDRHGRPEGEGINPDWADALLKNHYDAERRESELKDPAPAPKEPAKVR